MLSANRQSSVIQETAKIKENYEQGVNDIDSVYETLANNKSKKLNGYEENGLILYYDFKEQEDIRNNIIKDLSQNGNDGIINGGTLQNGALVLDGIDDWIRIKQLNYPNVTLEAVIEYDEVSESKEMSVISNLQSGGYALSNYSITGDTPFNKFTAYIGDTYYSVSSPSQIKQNFKYYLSGSYNGQILTLSENGNITTKEKQGNIKYPEENTIMVVGANPYGENVTGSFLKGKIYSIRIYNRALNNEEIQNNYKIDRARFENN